MKQFSGIVTSTKMSQTIVVEVSRRWAHPKYKKIVKRTRKYQVHDPQQKFAVGDHVNFVETKPISKHKRFQVIYPDSSSTN